MRQLEKKTRLAMRRLIARLGMDRDHRLIQDYMAGEGPKRLQLGCGKNYLSGWLNSDYHPKTRDVLHLDATLPLPFGDGVLDRVFTEHMIEHISFPDGVELVRECFRALKPGGIARIATPDLAFLIDIYRPDEPPERERTELQTQFLTHFLATEVKKREIHAPVDFDAFLINKFVRAWGHLFIYDEKTLRYVMEEAGFVDVERCEILESRHEDLQGLERVDRKPPGHLGLETLILEGTRSG